MNFFKLKFSFFFGILLIAFSISPLSVLLTSELFGNNIIEPFLILGLILVSSTFPIKVIIFSTFRNSYFLLFLWLLIILFVLGLMNSYQIDYVYADFRCNILLIFSFLLFSDQRLYELRDGFFIKFLLWSIILMDLFYSIIMLKSNLAGTGEARIRMISPISCVILMYLYLSRWRRIDMAFLLLLFLTWHTVVSAMRNFYIIFFLSFVMFLINLFFSFKIKFVYKFLVLSLIAFIPIYSWRFVWGFWMSDGSRSIHSVNRVEETISGESVETERLNSILLPFSDTLYYILPHGIGWRAFIDDIQSRYSQKLILSSMDSSFYYLCFHYGLIITLILIIILFFKLFKLFFKTRGIIQFNFVILTFLFVSAFFTQATMFAFLSFAFCYGVLLSQIFNTKINFNLL